MWNRIHGTGMTNADLALNIISQINATEHEEMCKYSTGMELGTVHITTNSNPSTDWELYRDQRDGDGG